MLVPRAVSTLDGVLLPLLLITGFLFGLAGGPIMTLTAPFLPPALRSLGMGILWAIYYGVMMAAPYVAGALAEGTGRTSTALLVGAGFSVVALVSLVLCRVVLGRPPTAS